MIFASLLVREPTLSFPLVMGFAKQLYIAVSVDVPRTKTVHMAELVYHSNTHTLCNTPLLPVTTAKEIKEKEKTGKFLTVLPVAIFKVSLN